MWCHYTPFGRHTILFVYIYDTAQDEQLANGHVLVALWITVWTVWFVSRPKVANIPIVHWILNFVSSMHWGHTTLDIDAYQSFWNMKMKMGNNTRLNTLQQKKIGQVWERFLILQFDSWILRVSENYFQTLKLDPPYLIQQW